MSHKNCFQTLSKKLVLNRRESLCFPQLGITQRTVKNEIRRWKMVNPFSFQPPQLVIPTGCIWEMECQTCSQFVVWTGMLDKRSGCQPTSDSFCALSWFRNMFLKALGKIIEKHAFPLHKHSQNLKMVRWENVSSVKLKDQK